MARVAITILAALLLGFALLWSWQAGRQTAEPPAEEQSRPAPEAPPATQRQVLQAPAPPGAAFAGCDTSLDEESMAARVAELEVQRQAMLPVLSASADAEHLLIAALWSWDDDRERAMSLFAEAAARDPRHPLIASQVLMLCTDTNSCGRARGELERRLIAADKGNVMAWVQVTRSRLQVNDEREALAALREATAAASLEDYFPEYVMLFDRGLAAASDLEPFDRMVAAVGHAAAIRSTAYLITRDCERRAAGLPEWHDACLRLGERFEHDGLTVLAQAIGIRLQAYMYELGGDKRAAEGAIRRQEEFTDQWTQLAAKTARAEEMRDATVFRQYLETFASAGEFQAMEYLATEVESRLVPLPNAQQPVCEAP